MLWKRQREHTGGGISSSVSGGKKIKCGFLTGSLCEDDKLPQLCLRTLVGQIRDVQNAGVN